MQQFKLFGRSLIRYISTKPENMMVVKKKPIAYKSGEPRIIETGEKGLAMAVIIQAWMDADHWHDTTNRRQSRAFLTGATEEWKESLDFWCSLAGNGSKGIIDLARSLYWKKEKIEEYRKLGK